MQLEALEGIQITAKTDNQLTVVVPEGFDAKEPLRIRLEGSGPESTTVTITVGARARVTIIEELSSTASTSHTTEIIAGDEAQVEMVSVNLCPRGTVVSISQRSSIGAGATVTWRNATLAEGETDHELQSRVTGANGISQVEWLFYARGSEQQKLRVRNIFDGVAGGGEILMKGVAEEKAHTKCNGMIEIGLKGGGTNTYLTQEVLMLDRTSKVDAIPGLEIKTNDVKASHSATVARVTEEDLFYFASRGIDALEARRMFVLGFIGDLAARISDTTTREAVIGAIEAKYSAGRA